MLHRIVILLALALFCAVHGKSAQAQTTAPSLDIIPFLEEVSYNPARLEVTAVFSYINTTGQAITVPIGARNVFSPPPGFRGQITEFLPGVNRRAFTAIFRTDIGPTLTWTLNDWQVTASNDPALYNPLLPRVQELETELGAYKSVTGALLNDVAANYGTLFGEPTFVIPGATTLEQLVNLRGGLLTIGHGTKYALYRKLGGRN